jgi:DNA-binding protein Fis
MKKEVESSIIVGRIKLDNPNFSLMYSVKHDDFGYTVLLKLFNEIEGRPVSKMYGIILNEKELDLLIETLQKLKDRMMSDVQS